MNGGSLFSAPGERAASQWLASLSPERIRGLGQRYARAAAQGGAVVTALDDRTTPIPLLLTPVGVPAFAFEAVSRDAHTLLAALVKLTRWLMVGKEQQPLRGLLFGRFSALETAGLAGWANAERLATARVDFLIDESGAHRALEVNATIPAMQGYSDAVADAWLAAVAAERGAQSNGDNGDNGSNGGDLLASLVAHYRQLRQAEPRSIAIVARAHDAQLGELQRYVSTWQERGYEVTLCTPADVRIDERGRALCSNNVHDLIYRHVFARRLSIDEPMARVCLDPHRFGLFNPLSSHLEVKGMLGLLSAAVDSAEVGPLGLDDDEQACVRRILPWTRLVYPQRTTAPDQSPIDDLQSWMAQHGPELVLKRSWDYGGRGVFLGADLAAPETQARLVALTGLPAPIGWPTLCDWIFDGSEEAWVVQSLVNVRRASMLRIEKDQVVERSLYVDLSAFTNCGIAERPRGGAARAAFGRIVNIQGGGGLAPVIRDELLSALFSD